MKDKLKYSDEQITAVARALCRDNSKICNVNNDDNWKMYSEDYIAQAHVALASLASVNILDAEGDGGAVAWEYRNLIDGEPMEWEKCSRNTYLYWSTPENIARGVAEVRQLYTHPARSGVVSDEDVERAIIDYWEPIQAEQSEENDRKGMRAALEHFAKGERHER